MTYSNANSHSIAPLTVNAAQTDEAYFASLPPALAAVIGLAMALMARLCAAFEQNLIHGRGRESRTWKISFIAFLIFMNALKGSRAEKAEFLRRVMAKTITARLERLKKLRAAYIIWRQRKCWMWGGGFMSAALSRLTDVFMGARDERSFDALIPN